jgi:hypothetical protein
MQRPVRSQLDPPPSAHAVTLPSDMLAMRRSGRTLDAAAAVSTAGAPLPGCGTPASPSMGRASSASVPPSRACPTPASSRRATSRRSRDSRCPARAFTPCGRGRRRPRTCAGPHRAHARAVQAAARCPVQSSRPASVTPSAPATASSQKARGYGGSSTGSTAAFIARFNDLPEAEPTDGLDFADRAAKEGSGLASAASPISAPGRSDFARSPDAANHPFGAYSAPFFFGT